MAKGSKLMGKSVFFDREARLLSFVYLSFDVMIKMDINNKLHIKSSTDTNNT